MKGVPAPRSPRMIGCAHRTQKKIAWRITGPSHTCLGFLLCCPDSSSLSRLGGTVGGRAVRRGVCVCATATTDHSQRTIGFVLLTTKALSKKIEPRAHWPLGDLSQRADCLSIAMDPLSLGTASLDGIEFTVAAAGARVIAQVHRTTRPLRARAGDL